MSVVVIKLGVGNTASVLFALERLGVRALLTDDAGEIENAERVILPGVGAATHAMDVLRLKRLNDALLAFGRPVLGICLGMQLLYEHSKEGDAEGLGVLPGTVIALSASIEAPSPHMGWAPVRIERRHALLDGIQSSEQFYFVHAYACPIDASTLAVSAYGRRFSAVVARGNYFGCQFHPERSGAAGARVLRNFLDLPC